MNRPATVLRAAAVLLVLAAVSTAAAAEENRQLAFEDEAPVTGGEEAAPAVIQEEEGAAPAVIQEEETPLPAAASVATPHPTGDHAIKHEQGREEDWGLRQREAERARQESKDRAGHGLGYEDVGSGADVRRGGDSKALSDQINRLGAAIKAQTDPCVCPDEIIAAVASSAAGAAGGAKMGVTGEPLGDSVFEIGDVGGDGLNRSQWDEEEYRKARDKRKKDLEKREKKLEKDLAKRRKDFLDSEEGKKTKKKLDEIEKERQKKQAELEKERIRRDREKKANCCGYGEIQKVLDWYLEEQEKIDEEAEKKKEKAIDEDMKKSDPKGQKKYQDAREEHENVEDELREIRRAEAFEREQRRKASMDR